MLVYIIVPITGTTDYLARFANAHQKLQNCGYTVVNPADVSITLPPLSQSAYMDVSMALLKHCDAICMLLGWGSSEGAGMEYGYARRHGMKFVDLETEEEVIG